MNQSKKCKDKLKKLKSILCYQSQELMELNTLDWPTVRKLVIPNSILLPPPRSHSADVVFALKKEGKNLAWLDIQSKSFTKITLPLFASEIKKSVPPPSGSTLTFLMYNFGEVDEESFKNCGKLIAGSDKKTIAIFIPPETKLQSNDKKRSEPYNLRKSKGTTSQNKRRKVSQEMEIAKGTQTFFFD